VLVTELTPKKPFPYEPFFMQKKFRFIEGYQGNDTVRGWRDFDSIYHAVFADMRGSPGYPKGEAYSTVPKACSCGRRFLRTRRFGLDSTTDPKPTSRFQCASLPDYGPSASR
jgi:hypothetical protein